MSSTEQRAWHFATTPSNCVAGPNEGEALRSSWAGHRPAVPRGLQLCAVSASGNGLKLGLSGWWTQCLPGSFLVPWKHGQVGSGFRVRGLPLCTLGVSVGLAVA